MRNPALANISLAPIAFAFAVVLSGCFFLVPKTKAPPPRIEVKMLGQARTASTPPEQVAVLAGTHELPVGLLFARAADGRKKLYAVPDIPSAGDAHAVIAAMAVVLPQTGAYPTASDTLAAFQKHASELGGNAIFRPEPGARYAYVVYVSPGQVAVPADSQEEILQRELAAQAGFAPAGPPRQGDLGATASIELPVRRGRCYAVSVALDPGARLNDNGQQHLVVESASGDPLMMGRSYMAQEPVARDDGFTFAAPISGRYVRLRSFTAPLGCAWQQGKVTIHVRTRGRSNVLGTGAYAAQILEQKISESELVAKKQQHDQAVAAAAEESRRFAEEERARQAEAERRREEDRRRDEERRAARSSASPGGSSSGASSSGSSGYFSFSLKNECRQTVRMFINKGGNPRFSGGTSTTIGANTIRSFSGSGSETYWIVDERGEGMSSFTAGPGQRDMRILPSCTGFAPR